MDYVSKFMNECISSNKSSVLEILECAQNRIKYIETETKKIEDLKKEEKSLKSLIKQLGGDSKPQTIAYIESTSSFKSLDLNIQNICFSIIEFIDGQQESSVRDIIDAVSSLEESRFVFASLKWLIDNKVLTRSESTRKVFKGELWEEKEKLLNIINLQD